MLITTHRRLVWRWVCTWFASIAAHAFLMIFFLIMPALLGGFTNLLVPIQIGSAEMALPRLNAISFMLLPPSLLLLLSCVHVEVGAGVGWTVYPPLSRRIGIGVDVAIVSLHLSGLDTPMALQLFSCNPCFPSLVYDVYRM